MRTDPASRVAFAAALALAVTGCGKKVQLPQVLHERPVVTLTQAPLGGDTRYFYAYELRWTGFDPDGRVDHYLYALDPPTRANADTAWVRTTANRITVRFPSGDPDSLGTKSKPGGFHTFAIKAVDNEGLASEPVTRAFYSYTVAPEVYILQPRPSHLLFPRVPPSVVVTWTGTDPDGQTTRKPVKYKYKIFKEGASEFDLLTMALNPDSMRRYYAPNFAGWDSTAGDTSVQIHDLIPSSNYAFAVVAFDEAGAYSPIFTFDSNILYFSVSFVGTNGPVLTMYNDSFSYTYNTGGYFNDPLRYVYLEFPSGTPITFYWSAQPATYATVKQFRWAMDIASLDDPSPRDGPYDYRHWSYSALSNTQATVGPFNGLADSTHLFYIEVEDNNGLKSLGILSFRIVRPTFQNGLLFVNDTRFSLDNLAPSGDSIITAGGDWPCAAEMDTFLYARGGFPWKYYPPGTPSPRGIFSGYDFDTMSTNNRLDAGVPLSTLARYRHVVWMVNQAPTFGVEPPILRYMAGPQHSNTLAIYARMGGNVWLMGGGGAYATLYPFNNKANDKNGQFISSAAGGELIPGRFMYDLPHWQSEISVLVSSSATVNPGLATPHPGSPDYTGLPPALGFKTLTSDPLPPYRGLSNFYKGQYDAEYLTAANDILELAQVTPDSTTLVSTLDTLYYTAGFQGGRPVMTYYHGAETPPFLFSGFPLWYFQRDQAKALGDWVLHTLWGLDADLATRRAPVARAHSRPVTR